MSSFWGFSAQCTSNRADWFLLPNVSNAQLPKVYDSKRFPFSGHWNSNLKVAPFAFYSFSRSIYSCIDLDCEPRVFELISDRNPGSLNLRVLIFSWLSGELFAVNMKHYPPSSGIQRGESYRAMKGHSAMWNWCSVDELCCVVFCCRMVMYSLIFGLAGLWDAFVVSRVSWWHYHCWYSEEVIYHQPHDCGPLKYGLEEPEVLFTQLDYHFYILKFRVVIPFVALAYSAAGVVRRNTNFASRFISSFCVL